MDIHVLKPTECLEMIQSGEIHKGTHVWQEFHVERTNPKYQGRLIELEYDGFDFITPGAKDIDDPMVRDYLLVGEITEAWNYEYVYRVWIGGKPSPQLRKATKWKEHRRE